MTAEQERLERARAKNLAYIRQQDELQASQAADELLASVLGHSGAKRLAGGSKGNSSVYVTGLTTYMACKQLEGICNKLGKVRRIKFYKDERGGLKGDAVVTFASRATMTKAVERLNHFEVKPGVIITATEATFASKKSTDSKENTVAVQPTEIPRKMPLEKVAALPLEASQGDNAALLELPSRSIILKHVWNPLDASDAAFFEELEDDMRSECSKHGPVEHVRVAADGSAVVRFKELNAAIACLKVMNGRWFAGRQVETHFEQSTAEEPSDADTKVEAFLASLGE